jgi:hypothetical protein
MNDGGEAMADTLSIADLPRTLRDMTGKRWSYQQLYRMVVDGDLPAEKNASGRWRVRRSDVPGIAEKLKHRGA